MKLMVIDDMQYNLELFQDMLGHEFNLALFSDPKEAILQLNKINPDLVLLDCIMPGLDGHKVLSTIKTHNPFLPVIMISGYRIEENLLQALDNQVDDFIYKPVFVDELVARIKNKIQKSQNRFAGASKADFKDFDDVILDDAEESIKIEDNIIRLKGKEYRLFKYLYGRRNQLVTREELFVNVWDDIYVSPATLDTHLCQLRKKLDHFGERIVTRKNTGFVYSTEVFQ